MKESNNNIVLFNSVIIDVITVYLGNNKINMIKNKNKCEIDYTFEKDGKYEFKIVFNDKITNLKGFFEGCTNIISLDLTNFNTLNVTNMEFMFNKCKKLKEIKGIDKFITNKVETMRGIFLECNALEHLDLSNFNTSNVINMEGMFNKCNKLKEIIGINKFITNKVTTMRVMFQHCNDLEYLDLSNFNTCNVTDMAGMFNECNTLKDLKGIDKFVTNKVTDMTYMFNKCNELEYLDLSNFNTSNVNSMESMFGECNKLKY